MPQPAEIVAAVRPPIDASLAVERWAWLRAGIAVAAVAWGANQFAPLLLVYRSRLGLSATTVEAMFGFYALGLIPALLVCGPLSDRFGRRPVMVSALLASGVATVLLIGGGSAVGLLFAGRLVAGFASGAAFSSGAAWIKELSAAGGTDGGSSGPRRVTVSMTAGFGGGPLVAGFLAQWLPDPTVVPYLPHLALLMVALVLRTPETHHAARAAGVGRRPRLIEPRGGRFWGVVVPLAPWVFGSASIALAYLPALVEHRLGHTALAFTAVVTMLAALAGILVQPVARRVDLAGSARLIGVSLALVLAGLLVSAVAAATEEPAVVVVAILVLGAGYGACQVCGLQEIQRLARPESLAALTAVYQAVSYLGFALPFLLAAAARVASPVVLLLVVAGLAATTLGWTVRRAAAPPRPDETGACRQPLFRCMPDPRSTSSSAIGAKNATPLWSAISSIRRVTLAIAFSGRSTPISWRTPVRTATVPKVAVDPPVLDRPASGSCAPRRHSARRGELEPPWARLTSSIRMPRSARVDDMRHSAARWRFLLAHTVDRAVGVDVEHAVALDPVDRTSSVDVGKTPGRYWRVLLLLVEAGHAGTPRSQRARTAGINRSGREQADCRHRDEEDDAVSVLAERRDLADDWEVRERQNSACQHDGGRDGHDVLLVPSHRTCGTMDERTTEDEGRSGDSDPGPGCRHQGVYEYDDEGEGEGGPHPGSWSATSASAAGADGDGGEDE